MKDSKTIKILRYNFWFAAGMHYMGFNIIPVMCVCYNNFRASKWWYYFSFEIGWLAWSVGIFAKKD
jgi:hypothetical protein